MLLNHDGAVSCCLVLLGPFINFVQCLFLACVLCSVLHYWLSWHRVYSGLLTMVSIMRWWWWHQTSTDVCNPSWGMQLIARWEANKKQNKCHCWIFWSDWVHQKTLSIISRPWHNGQETNTECRISNFIVFGQWVIFCQFYLDITIIPGSDFVLLNKYCFPYPLY